ncbi:MAG: LacI family DNA-binding transcriptional regulator [Capsulimonadaceae bacterium]|nr:LacI family DNA-binding transcriptional regulator [Capsulimonadaceae bacterium]
MATKTANSLEVAKRAGVSQATVSYVLNKRGDQSISESTRQRVLDAARDLNYRPNRLANGVLRGKSNIVGVITTYLNSDFHASVMTGTCDVLAENGYHTYIASATGNATLQRDVELMLEHRVEGIIWLAESAPWIREAIGAGVPWVIVDDNSLADIADCVVSNDVAGARLAIDHLVALGHRRIAFWSAEWDSSSYRDRRHGYAAALASHGISVDPSLVRTFPLDARRAAIELHDFLSLPEPPTAFFFTSDINAMVALHAAQDTGIAVPGDIAITGYSGQDYADFNDITTVSQNAREMGRKAASLLLRRLADPAIIPGTYLTATKLIVRGSTVHQPAKNRFYPLPNNVRH